jgi:hypothetical protein
LGVLDPLWVNLHNLKNTSGYVAGLLNLSAIQEADYAVVQERDGDFERRVGHGDDSQRLQQQQPWRR